MLDDMTKTERPIRRAYSEQGSRFVYRLAAVTYWDSSRVLYWVGIPILVTPKH